jgi:hypothetical protein
MIDPGPREIVVLGAAPLEEQHSAVAGRLQGVGAEVEHDELLSRSGELLGGTASDTAEPADDEVVPKLSEHPAPSLLLPSLSGHLAGDRLDGLCRQVAKDSHARDGKPDRQQLRAQALGPRVEPGEGRRDRGAVEGAVPCLVQELVERDRPHTEHGSDRENCDSDALRVVSLHRSSIVRVR